MQHPAGGVATREGIVARVWQEIFGYAYAVRVRTVYAYQNAGAFFSCQTSLQASSGLWNSKQYFRQVPYRATFETGVPDTAGTRTRTQTRYRTVQLWRRRIAP